MFCITCGNRNDAGVSFCRRCGAGLSAPPTPARARQNLSAVRGADGSKDPDELTGSGVGSVIVGDGFFIVALILSASHGAAGGLLWLSLLIPAFYFFGRGTTDLLHARRIRLRQRRAELPGAETAAAELPPPRAPLGDLIRKTLSGQLAPAPSVTERTTRDLK